MRKGVKGGKEDTEEEKKEKEGVQVEGVEEGEGGEGGECFLTGTRMQRQVHLPTAAQPLLLDAMRSLKPSKRLSDEIWDSTKPKIHTPISETKF